MASFLLKINLFLLKAEKKFLPLGAALIVGAIVLLLAANYVTPKFEPRYHGHTFSHVSINPFDFENISDLHYRLLGPVIGYFTGLRGELFLLVPLLFGLFFIGAVYFVYRQKKFEPVDAVAVALMIGFSCTILIPLISPGYTDTISYFFVFLAFATIKRWWLCGLMYSLALLNHESNLALLPALVVFMGYNHKQWGKWRYVYPMVIFLVALIPLLLVRNYVSQFAQILYSTEFYFNRENLKTNVVKIFHLIPMGIFLAFKLFWYFPLVFLFMRRKSNVLKLVVVLIIGGTASQLLIAYDITRLMSLAFPAILIGIEQFKDDMELVKFRSFTWKLIGFNLLILSYFMAAEGIQPLLPWWLYSLAGM